MRVKYFYVLHVYRYIFSIILVWLALGWLPLKCLFSFIGLCCVIHVKRGYVFVAPDGSLASTKMCGSTNKP